MKHLIRILALGLVLSLLSCISANQQLELDLRKSLKLFLESARNLNEEGLKASVYFPGVTDYRQHVRDLQLKYLEDATEKGQLEFDPQGVIAGRFLGLLHHSYFVKKLDTSEDGLEVTMLMGINFNYDNNLTYDYRGVDYEPGTRVLIPGAPWGTVLTIRLGEDNATPREQLSYAEIRIKFRKTNFEGYWQVRELEVLEEQLEYVVSFKSSFE